MRFKLYEDFTSSTEKYIPQELALITVRYLYQNNPDSMISREQYLSPNDRKAISREWGNRLPNGFPTAANGMVLGNLLAPILTENPTFLDTPYFDDADLVFGSNTRRHDIVFRCKVVGRSIASTWKELGDWLKKNMTTNENLLDLWLDSDLSLADFKEKYKGRIAGKKYGLS